MANAHEDLIDQADRLFRDGDYTKGANLVRKAAFGALSEAASKRGLNCGDLKEALKTAEKLESERPGSMLPHDEALAFSHTFITQAATHGTGGDWEWSREEYSEHLDCIRQFLKDMEAISQEPAAAQADNLRPE